MPEKEGDAIREYKAMQEENFLSSCPREDGRKKEVRTVEMGNENEEERGEERRSEGEKEEDGTETVKRRCVGSVSVEATLTFSVKAETWRVVVIFLGETFWISLRTCLIVSLYAGGCAWCD